MKKFWRKLRFLGKRRQFARDLEEEMRIHVEMLGSQRAFGNSTLLKEMSREVWGFNTLDTLRRDVRYALRMLRRSPAFTTVAVLSLALGIGTNTAIFSLIDALMLKTLPVKQPEQLVELLTVREPGKGFNFFSYPTYEAFRDRNHVLSGLVASATDKFYVVVEGGEPERVEGQFISGDFFNVLGVNPWIGQLIGSNDDRPGAPRGTATISYAYWKRRFGLDPAVLGKAITIEGVPFRIAGVTPPGFFGVQVGRVDDISIPFAMQAQVRPPNRAGDAGSKWIRLLGRLRPGVSIAHAHAEIGTIFQQTLTQEIQQLHHADAAALAQMRTWTVDVIPGGSGISRLRQQFGRPLMVLIAMVSLVLLIACANVANLLLARAAVRQKEISLRLAIGAGRLQLIRQMLTESVLLAFVSGTLGLALAWWASNFLVTFMATGRLPIRLEVQPDARILAFTAAVSFLTAVLFGIAPAMQAARADIFSTLKEAGRGATAGRGFRHGLGKALVVSQVVVSVVLLAGAGLFTRTLLNLEHVDLGFQRDHVLLVALDPAHSGYNGAQLSALYKQLLERFKATPGVRAASVSYIAPIGGGGVNRTLAGRHESVYVNWISPGYFETLGTSLVLGRDFNSHDDERSPKVAMINERMARLFFGDANPLGQRVTFEPGITKEIVGVVKDAKYLEIRETTPATIFLDTFQEQHAASQFEVRTAGDPSMLIATLRREIDDLTNGRIAIGKTYTLAEQVDASIVRERLIAVLSAFFGAIGLLLSAVGLYGLLAYMVARRSNEIGIRVALGAARRDVVRMVLSDAIVLVAIGLALGIPLALASARFIASQLYGVSAHDATAIGGSAIMLLGVALLAAWLPARRASRVDPMVSLRCE